MPRKKTTSSRSNLPATRAPKALALPRRVPLAGKTVEPTQIFAIPERHPRGQGPWTGEPDRIGWRDAQTGLDCLVLRQDNGTWSGYVAVPPGHPLSGHRYDAVTSAVRRAAHRGLGYSELCDRREVEALAVCHVEFRPRRSVVPSASNVSHEDEAAWWFGFECDKPGDLVPSGHKPHRHAEEGEVYRDVNYVAGETMKLASALKAFDSSGVPIDAQGPLAAPARLLGKPLRGDKA